MASTGLLASVLWFSGAWILSVTGVANGTLGFFFGVGLFFLPLAIPTSFLVGTVLWGTMYPEEEKRLYGAIFGGITSLSSLAVGAVGPALILGISNIRGGEMSVPEAVVFSAVLLPAGFLFAMVAAGWVVLPLGIFGGWYHERAKDVP